MTDKIGIMLPPEFPAERDLAARANCQTRRRAPERLAGVTRSVHFLRGVESRAIYSIPAFYFLSASSENADRRTTIEGGAGIVFQSYINQASINYLAMACRKVFDRFRKGPNLTGGGFAQLEDWDLRKHADYWANSANCSNDDAYRALSFLRSLFKKCVKNEEDQLKRGEALARRIGLIKQFADRRAAHISLENYAVRGLDFAHVTSVLCLMGEIIRRFDRPGSPAGYFDRVDAGAFDAAKELFPELPGERLFHGLEIAPTAELLWEGEHSKGLMRMMNGLPQQSLIGEIEN